MKPPRAGRSRPSRPKRDVHSPVSASSLDRLPQNMVAEACEGAIQEALGVVPRGTLEPTRVSARQVFLACLDNLRAWVRVRQR